MKYVRMIVWTLLLVALVAFSVTNWQPVEVKIWDNLILETKLPALVVGSFLLGLLPMWLIHRGVRWRLHRRIAGLESAHRSASVTAAAREAAPGGLAPDSTESGKA
jgi:uncharacterized integral membrane protein